MKRVMSSASCILLLATVAFSLQHPSDVAASRSGPVIASGDPMASDQPQATWEPPTGDVHGKLTRTRLQALPDTAYAFPRARKEPLTDAAHVRSAIARFSRVSKVTDKERELAFANIQKAARYFGVHVKAASWRQMARM